ncbi:unnamed protein product [Chrysoparadoxa australica]
MSNGAVPKASTPLIFKVPELLAPVVRSACEERGWVEWKEGVQEEDEWDFQWRNSRYKMSEYVRASSQRMNHIPKSSMITMKDALLRSLRKMEAIYGPVYGFHPQGFILPTEYTKFISAYTAMQGEEGSNMLWIVKPHDSSRGRKIFLIKSLGELTYDQQSIIQRYIPPLLVCGYKLDLRLYVAVTSMHPLECWIYDKGIVRFATTKYDESDHGDLCSHLTNSTINKHTANAASNKEGIGPGCKWTLSRLRGWFVQQAGEEGEARWQKALARIEAILVLTTLMMAPVVPKKESQCCFELLGFDILLDQGLTPHLIEVNCSPALGLEEPADREVKVPLMRDLLALLDVEVSTIGARLASHADALRKASAPMSRRSVAHSHGSQGGANATANGNARTKAKASNILAGRKAPVHGGDVSTPHSSDSRGTGAGSSAARFARAERSGGRSSCTGTEKRGSRANTASSGAENESSDDAAKWRCRRGGFERIFPFNEVSHQQAQRMSNHSSKGGGKKTSSAQVNDCFRAIVSEIRRHLRLKTGSQSKS